MWRLRPANKPRSACAEFADGLGCRFAQSSIVCQAEESFDEKLMKRQPAISISCLGTSDFTKMSIQRSRAQRFQLLRKEILHHKR
jgi:hypothetical protein